ncbi:UNVERIFIED_CONTAM: hypothetical protein GTU68_061720 [Idotea baltica]|nr:hypothetical protein [Idotea baltica]
MLFDGVCNLCNNTVQFVIERDVDAKIMFASLQSEVGQQILTEYNLPTNDFDSFVLLKNGKIYQRSTAALKVAAKLGTPYSLMALFLIIPEPIRDAAYSFIAKNRYKWFGKEESCWLPTPELKSRFL